MVAMVAEGTLLTNEMEESMQSGIWNQEDHQAEIPIKGIACHYLSAAAVPARGVGFIIEEEKSKKSLLQNKPYNLNLSTSLPENKYIHTYIH